MFECEWKLIGEVNVPEEKKDELNNYILTLFDKCGIRKIKEINLCGKNVIVAEKVRPDENGVCRFDYSTFDNEQRKECSYDFNTCQLDMQDHGNYVFGLVLNQIMLLLESYTDGMCYSIYDGRQVPYMYLLKCVLGRKFYMENRGRLWEQMLFFRKNKIKFSRKDIMKNFPWEFASLDVEQFGAIICINKKKFFISNEDEELISRDEIKKSKTYKLINLLHAIMSDYYEKNEKELCEYLKKLLELNLEDRKKLAEKSDVQGIMAELSLYLLPTYFVESYAILKGIGFWKAWDQLKINGYLDIIREKNDEKEEDYFNDFDFKWGFYKKIYRKDEDDFLEFWNGENLILSNWMKERILEWKRLYVEIGDIEEYEVESYLADIITDMADNWNCRYVDSDFVEMIMEHKTDANYRKALVLLKTISDDKIKYFPELTRKQVIMWILEDDKIKKTKKEMLAFQSFFINQTQRKIILGF